MSVVGSKKQNWQWDGNGWIFELEALDQVRKISGFFEDNNMALSMIFCQAGLEQEARRCTTSSKLWLRSNILSLTNSGPTPKWRPLRLMIPLDFKKA
jgi:hypothetical protein